jgi:hypothetical protein
MANTGFNLNRGLIRRFDYSNLPTNNVKLAPAANGIISIQNNLSNFVQNFGANNIARIQNLRSEDTYNNSESTVTTISTGGTLNVENLNTENLNTGNLNLNTTSGDVTFTSESLGNVDLTNFVSLTSL